MNGARSIFMRKGYWLTALAAIVLLAASPGTAQAQDDHHGSGRGRPRARPPRIPWPSRERPLAERPRRLPSRS